MQYEGGAFDEQKSSNIYFYLPSTRDRNEKKKQVFDLCEP